MIAYHYPPSFGSSGIHRTLKFSQYLPGYGWEPIVLTIHPRAYPAVCNDQLSEIPNDIRVVRAFGVDAARHLAVKGIYPRAFALPDRWVSWWLGAVPAGLRLIRELRPDILWSTYPISTAHLIGLTLHRLTDIPWVADFRDPMAGEDFPLDPVIRRLRRWIERQTVHRCARTIVTAPGAVRWYEERFKVPLSRLVLIPNGYDEASFAAAERIPHARERTQQTLLLHSGLLSPVDRDPRQFFAALSDLLRTRRIGPDNLKVILRAPGHEEYLTRMIAEHGLKSIVFVEGPLPYREALTEMLAADGLLLFQASNCNPQVPAKLYEYLRAKRPIFAMTDPTGDTAAVLQSFGTGSHTALDSKDAIMEGISTFIENVRQGQGRVASDETISLHSRESRAAQLAAVLDAVH